MNYDVINAVCAAVILGEGENYEPVHLEPREARQAIAAYLSATGAGDRDRLIGNLLDRWEMTPNDLKEEMRENGCGKQLDALLAFLSPSPTSAAAPPAPAEAKVDAGEVVVDLEEAIRLAEVGEYLYNSCSYEYGDGYSEPFEFGIEWGWVQSKPDEYGQGKLLAEAVTWHAEQAEDGIVTEASKLRAALSSATGGA